MSVNNPAHEEVFESRVLTVIANHNDGSCKVSGVDAEFSPPCKTWVLIS